MRGIDHSDCQMKSNATALMSRRANRTNRSSAVRADIRRWLRRKPFQPFFLILGDGCCGLVHNPEFIVIKPGDEFEVYSRGSLVTAKYSGVTRIAALTVVEALRYAETVLPGRPPRKGSDPDSRWQAVILVGEFIESKPEAVWEFIKKWGCHRQSDLRGAIVCCLLEHLLEYHFAEFFPKVKEHALKSANFAEMCIGMWKFGQSEEPANSKQLDQLSKWLDVLKEQRKRKRRRR